jgi:PAS domain S-box-containing protein
MANDEQSCTESADPVASVATTTADRLGRTSTMLRLLSVAAGDLVGLRQPDQIVDNLFHAISVFLGADHFFHYRLDEADSGPVLRMEASFGLDAAACASIETLELGQFPCGVVAQHRRMLHLVEIQSNNDPRAAFVRDAGLHVYIGFPLLAGDRLLGTLSFASQQKERFTDDEIEFIATLSHYVALARERDLREQALRASEERFRLAAEAMNGLVYDWDMTRNTVERSRGMAELLGWNPPELPDSGNWWYEQIHADDLPLILGQFQRAIANQVNELEYEYRVRHKNGHYVWVWDRCRIVFSDSGFALRCIGCSVGIDRRRRAEEELRKSEARLQTVVENLVEGLVISDLQGDILHWNHAALEMHGFNIPDDSHKQLAEFVRIFELSDTDGNILPLEQWPLSRILRGEMIRDMEIRIRRINSDWQRNISYGGTIVRDPHGDPLLAVVTMYDITERKQAEESVKRAKEAAEAANRAKDHFLAVLSHELRTPLTPVLAAAQVLAADPNLSAPQREMMEMIQRNASLEARLIDDLLDLTRIARGKLDMHPEPVDLHRKIAEVVAMMARELETKEIQLFVEFAALAHNVEGDPARLQQIVWNLLHNAIKFTPTGGIVRVRTDNPGADTSRFELLVADSGIGIEPALIPHVFNAFEQGSADVTRKFGGLGLGLAISKALVDMHGGTIQAHSDGRNLGSQFRVNFPTTTAAVKKSSGSPKAPSLSGAERQLSVLLVEDHADTRRTMSRLLSVAGAAVTTAGSVAEALTLADEQRFDLLLSDIGLPDGSGLEVVSRIKQHRPETPCVALSGYGMEDDIRRSREAGFDEHLTKPIDLDRLQAVIARLSVKP